MQQEPTLRLRYEPNPRVAELYAAEEYFTSHSADSNVLYEIWEYERIDREGYYTSSLYLVAVAWIVRDSMVPDPWLEFSDEFCLDKKKVAAFMRQLQSFRETGKFLMLL